MDFIEVEEGSCRFFAPSQDQDAQFPPGTAPVFYNPRMELNRDATVLVTSVLSPSQYLDAMGATGVRGLRVAMECNIPVTINDHDPRAFEMIRMNVCRTGRQIEVLNQDVNVLLSGRRFDAVDLDPYGSPAPYLDSAVRGTRRYLMVTATDTAPLCGAHRAAGIRRYWASALNNEYHAETGLRVLIAAIVREVVKYDLGLLPLFCFAREHYVRLHLQLTRGAGNADHTLRRIGFIHQCPHCPERTEQQGFLPVEICCSRCRARMIPVGPLWLGSVQDASTLDSMSVRLEDMALNSKNELGKLLRVLGKELPTSSHYDYHLMAKRAGISPPPIDELVMRLQNAGFQASRAHYSGTALKTDAPLDEIFRIL